MFLHCYYQKTNDWGMPLDKLKKTILYKNLANQLGSTIIFSKHLIKYFIKKRSGNLIFFSSIYGFSSPNFEDYNNKIYSNVEYGAIKSGVISITRYFAKLYKKKGLRVNCISPGGIEDNQENYLLEITRKGVTPKAYLNLMI